MTATSGASGKTTLAANLARVAARGGARTLLIEADPAHPKLAEMISEGAEPGLIEVWGAKRILYEFADDAGQGILCTSSR